MRLASVNDSSVLKHLQFVPSVYKNKYFMEMYYQLRYNVGFSVRSVVAGYI
jgi:hypothetical protein